MMPRNFQEKLIAVAIGSALSSSAVIANAAGFALIEQNASGLGNAYSGAAAAVEDASTVYFNPAGMSLLPNGRQFALAAHYISPSTKFSNSASVGATVNPAAGPTAFPSDGDAGRAALVPNAYFVMNINPDWKIGIGLNAPFGLATEYSSDWGGRFQGIKSSVKTVNINPAISFKVNDKISLGLGLNYQKIDGEFTSETNYGAAVFNGAIAAGATVAAAAAAAAGVAAAGQADGRTTLEADDNRWGWNAGAMIKLGEQTRLGVAYRSRINYSLTGSVVFDNRPAVLAAAVPNGPIKLDVKMPDTLSFGLHHILNDRWQMLGDLTWTGWSVLQKFEPVRTDTGAVLQSIPYNWKNTWRVGVGANYKMNDTWMLKMGLAYDQTPTTNNDRGVRLPDGNRTWLSLGAKYALSKAGAIDIGYAHLFLNNPSINNNAGGVNQNSTAAFALVNGSYKSSVDILSVQYSRTF